MAPELLLTEAVGVYYTEKPSDLNWEILVDKVAKGPAINPL